MPSNEYTDPFDDGVVNPDAGDVARWIKMMVESDMETGLEALCDTMPECVGDDTDITARMFSDTGVMTNNAGVVIDFGTGDQFQVAVVRSR